MRLALDFSWLIDALAAVVVGVGLPHVALRQQINRRLKKFVTLMPEALDLIVRGIRSGLPASEALKTIADEIDDPVGTEFRQVTDQMRIGVALDEAMWSAARRLGIAEFNFLVISLSIQQETGGNLAEILEKLSDMVRRREQMRLKVKAMSSEARASAMIIGSLPFIMCGADLVRESRLHERPVHRSAWLGDDRRRADQPADRPGRDGEDDQVRDMNELNAIPAVRPDRRQPAAGADDGCRVHDRARRLVRSDRARSDGAPGARARRSARRAARQHAQGSWSQPPPAGKPRAPCGGWSSC